MLARRPTRRRRGRRDDPQRSCQPIGFGPQFNACTWSATVSSCFFQSSAAFASSASSMSAWFRSWTASTQAKRSSALCRTHRAGSPAPGPDGPARQELRLLPRQGCAGGAPGPVGRAQLLPAEAERDLANCSLAVIAATEQEPAPEGARLFAGRADSGIPLLDADQANIAVVSVDDYLRADLKELQRPHAPARTRLDALQGGRRHADAGAAVCPAAAPCWQCLATAMIENRPGDAVIGRQNDAARPARGFTTASLRLAANFAALEIARALGQSAPSSLERRCARARSRRRAAPASTSCARNPIVRFAAPRTIRWPCWSAARRPCGFNRGRFRRRSTAAGAA